METERSAKTFHSQPCTAQISDAERSRAPGTGCWCHSGLAFMPSSSISRVFPVASFSLPSARHCSRCSRGLVQEQERLVLFFPKPLCYLETTERGLQSRESNWSEFIPRAPGLGTYIRIIAWSSQAQVLLSNLMWSI